MQFVTKRLTRGTRKAMFGTPNIAFCFGCAVGGAGARGLPCQRSSEPIATNHLQHAFQVVDRGG
jgi:hypothetical protein